MADEVTRLRRSLANSDEREGSSTQASSSPLFKILVVAVVGMCAAAFVHGTKQSERDDESDPLFQKF